MSGKFQSLDELIKEYYGLVQKNKEGLPPYATFKTYLVVDENDCCIDRPTKIQNLVKNLNSDEHSVNAILELWSHGGKVYVENEAFENPKLVHSVSNTTRLQVFLKGGKKVQDKGVVLNNDNLLAFAKKIGNYIQSFKEGESLKENPINHDLKSNKTFQELLENNIDSVVNELLFWYYYAEDKYPIINSRAKKSRLILNQAFSSSKESKDIEFINRCINIESFDSIKKEESEEIYISKQLMLDQLFYTIDEMKSMKRVDEVYKDNKESNIYKFYQKLWNTIKDFKNIVNNAEFFESLLKKSKNIILYGAPGTGKTHTSEKNIERIVKENENTKEIKENRFVKVQFHPSYSYEDFIEGLKPILKNDNVSLELKDGEFMQFCKTALKYQDKYRNADKKDKMKWSFFFLVDEINRAELSRVFGEVMYALEKRGQGISTQYSYLKKEGEKEFIIPENVYFIGTMNDVDRSIDSFDIALRRRFFWYRMDCDYSVVFNELETYANIGELGSKNIPDSGYIKACYNLNQYITDKDNESLGLGKLFELGHSYFLNIRLHTKNSTIENKALNSLFDFSIEPLLREYLRAEYSEDEIEGKLKEAKKRFKIDDTNS